MGSCTGKRRWPSYASGWIKFVLLGVVVSVLFQGVACEVEPTESQCRPYIEKALKEQHLEVDERGVEEPIDEEFASQQERTPPTDDSDSTEGIITNEAQNEGDDDDGDDAEVRKEDEDGEDDGGDREEREGQEEDGEDDENGTEVESVEETKDDGDGDEGTKEDTEEDQEGDEEKTDDDQNEEEADDRETGESDKSEEKELEKENEDDDDGESRLNRAIDIEVQEIKIDDQDDEEDDKVEQDDVESDDESKAAEEEDDAKDEQGDQTEEEETAEKEEGDDEGKTETDDDTADEKEIDEDKAEEKDADEDKTDEREDEEKEVDEDVTDEKEEDSDKTEEKDDKDADQTEEDDGTKEDTDDQDDKVGSVEKQDEDAEEKLEKVEVEKSEAEGAAESEDADGSKEDGDQESTPEEEELIKEVVIPDNLRPRDHISKILKLEDSEMETTLEKAIDTTLKSLKGLYDTAIKPLEMLYKYRDLSNRHFGDPEIFSKPLILFMGPWSGGKSSTINYLLDNEFSHTSLRTGAEPSPAYFNILMHGEEEEILDGTQLAADWTFSGLQKFGQSLLDRLRGIKLPNKLLEKVNIVEIPGILEIRKQVQRLFPFNDACQWFIDRADIIFLVYDPSKLDVGPETEAILDQLKGREYQTRIILNKADQVKPEELMRVQGTLIWNISPLMSSSEPPIMYSTSLWSLPYEAGAPTRLLLAQERAFLRDLREAIDKRVENKIASARRFAVRVRNHAKMVDCYLTTYYNHKSFFGNRKKISDDIIEYPQKYHIYEGLSTLTNISRYDLPDPDVYKDFFKINPLYEFKKLSETCTYFRGCPINKLDVSIAYDLPELVGKYKKAVEATKEKVQKENS